MPILKTESLVADLRAIVGDRNVLADPDELVVYECDGFTVPRSAPDAVVFPDDTEQTAAVVKCLAAAHVSILPRGAGTGLAGGCLNTSTGVCVCTSKMRRILDIDTRNRVARVEAGVVNQHLTRAVQPMGFRFAPDPSSEMACTIGANAATNSGGAHTLKYGVSADHILGLTVVLPDGEVVELGGACADADGLALADVLIGSEGTLGIITEVTVRLTREPAAYRALLAVFDCVPDAVTAVSEIIAEGIIPAAMEMMDGFVLRTVEQRYGFGLPEDAGAVLIIELDGVEAGLDDEMERVNEICRRHNLRKFERAASDAERVNLWKCRKLAFGALGKLPGSYCTQDGVVPRTKLPDIVRFLADVAGRYEIRIPSVFHAGDGNLHPILMYDEREEGVMERALGAGDEIMAECVRLGGSVTAEHGIGVEKVKYMSLMFTEADLAAQRRLKDVFDPGDLANPGKVLPGVGPGIEMSKPMRQAPH